MSLCEHFLQAMSLYLQGTDMSRIWIRIKVKSLILIRIKVKSRIWIRIKVRQNLKLQEFVGVSTISR